MIISPTYLYLAYGELLYVGITVDIFKRYKQHMRKSVWFDQVHSWGLRDYDYRASAEKAEAKIIEEQKPPYNKRRGNLKVL